MTQLFKKFGPGFLFAGAAIGVSHLVQSTRAGADFGFGLVWALLLINIIKYPFFQFGPRYASATGENLLQGYAKMSRWVLVAYFIITLATMFTIQTAVTIVTAGIASSLFASGTIVFWTTAVTSGCFLILLLGKYKILDSLMKYIVIVLSLSTICAVILATYNFESSVTFKQMLPNDAIGIAFLIAFMGWMPAPLDITIWQSIWTVEKKKLNPNISFKESLFDFNVGFITTIFLGVCFIALGALVMYGSGETFSSSGTQFANQLIGMYTTSLGGWAKIVIGIAALATMFSTTLTTLDASPRVMKISSELIFNKPFKKGYLFWLLVLIIGTLSIFFFFVSEMGLLIQIATVLSFLTAPFYAIISFLLITGKHTPKELQPSKGLKIFSILGIGILIGFCVWYLSS